MIQISHEVKGFEELYEKLKALSNPIVAKEALREGLRLGGIQVQNTAKQLCPVDTGQLRNSIAVENLPDNGSMVGVKIAPHAEYAVFVEFGTGQQGDPSVPHTTKEKWTYKGADGKFYTTSGQPPQPYLYPALAANTDNVLNLVKTTLQEEIRKR